MAPKKTSFQLDGFTLRCCMCVGFRNMLCTTHSSLRSYKTINTQKNPRGPKNTEQEQGVLGLVTDYFWTCTFYWGGINDCKCFISSFHLAFPTSCMHLPQPGTFYQTLLKHWTRPSPHLTLPLFLCLVGLKCTTGLLCLLYVSQTQSDMCIMVW